MRTYVNFTRLSYAKTINTNRQNKYEMTKLPRHRKLIRAIKVNLSDKHIVGFDFINTPIEKCFKLWE
jgi:hypothetical protein